MIEWKYASVDLGNDVTTIAAEPCLVKGYLVTTGLSAQDCQIKDGTTAVITIPASAGVGDTLDLQGVRFETSLIVDPDNAATGVVTLFYVLLREPH